MIKNLPAWWSENSIITHNSKNIRKALDTNKNRYLCLTCGNNFMVRHSKYIKIMPQTTPMEKHRPIWDRESRKISKFISFIGRSCFLITIEGKFSNHLSNDLRMASLVSIILQKSK